MHKYKTIIILSVIALLLFIVPIVLQIDFSKINKNYSIEQFAEDKAKYAALGGEFVADSKNGKIKLSELTKRGVVVLHFGFTRCPDVCPTTLANLGAGLELMDDKDRKYIVPIMLSVDPEYDTTELLNDYTTFFVPEMIGLHGGSWQQTKAIAKSYGAYLAKVDMPDSELGYTIAHTTRLYVITEDGIATLLKHNQDPQSIADILVAFVRNR